MLLVSLVMSALVAVLCAGMAGAAATGPDTFPWLLAALPLGALVPALVYLAWLRGHGLLDPHGWLRVAFAVGGVQVLAGAIPCAGVAVNLASAAGQVIAGGLFVLTWVCAAASAVAARGAARLLVTPLVPELGATGFRLVVGVRFAVTAPQLLSAGLEILTDRLMWTIRAHRGRSAGPAVRGAVPFRELVRAVPTLLPEHPALHLWVTMPDGTQLYAQPGPALLLATPTGQWLIPVHDAAVVAAVVDRRRQNTTEGTTL